MTFQRLGGCCALACALTYIVGFALLLTLFAPLGFGTGRIDSRAVVSFIDAQPGILIVWNSIIYIANGLALTVLVMALGAMLDPASPAWAAVSRGFGLIWAALVLGAGMIANVGVMRVASTSATDPVAAAELWQILHAVELGLGGGNEIVGGVWILCVSLAVWRSRALYRPIAVVGVLSGIGGLATVIPGLGETAGAVFGLGAIAWFLAIGAAMIVKQPPAGADMRPADHRPAPAAP